MEVLKPSSSRIVRGLVAAAALALGLGGTAARAQEPPASLPEYVLKAGFLYNFAKYVDWPASAFDAADAPISIGIVGKDPFGEQLEKALKGKSVRNRSFSILRFPAPADLKRCHILFVARSERPHLPEILSQVQRWPVLTVGEDDGFSSAGGTTNILISQEKPQLEVNPDAAEKAGLTISAKLLKAATIVRTGK